MKTHRSIRRSSGGRTGRGGFTLFELLAVIALMGYWLKRHILKNHLEIEGYEWDLRLSAKSDLFNAAMFVAVLPIAYFIGTWALLLWIGNRWDPYQRRRDRIYAEHEQKLSAGEAS